MDFFAFESVMAQKKSMRFYNGHRVRAINDKVDYRKCRNYWKCLNARWSNFRFEVQDGNVLYRRSEYGAHLDAGELRAKSLLKGKGYKTFPYSYCLCDFLSLPSQNWFSIHDQMEL